MMDRSLFFQELNRLNYKDKILSDFIWSSRRVDYLHAIEAAASTLEKHKIVGVEALIAFGSHIRRPGISDIDTGLVVNKSFTPEALQEVERHLLSPENRPYFYHRPGLVIPTTLFDRYKFLAPIFHDPKVLWASKTWVPQQHIVFDQEAANLISLTDYMLLTGLSEPFELWAQPTADIRLMLAKFGSCRHIESIFNTFHIPFPSSGNALLNETDLFSQRYTDKEKQSTPEVREQLAEMTYLWFITLHESLLNLSDFIKKSLLSDLSSSSLLSGQLSESRPLVKDFSAENASSICVASLKARMAPVIMAPVELASFVIRSYQYQLPTLLAQMSCRLLYGEVITFKENRIESICAEKTKIFSQQLSFLNANKIPYGLFHPYGTYFFASSPFNPHVESTLALQKQASRKPSRIHKFLNLMRYND